MHNKMKLNIENNCLRTSVVYILLLGANIINSEAQKFLNQYFTVRFVRRIKKVRKEQITTAFG